MADYVVEGTPEACLQATFDHMVNGAWPFRGEVSRLPNAVIFEEYQGQNRSLIDSLGGLAVLIVLSLLTGGAFLIVYILYREFFKDRLPGRAELFATPEGQGMTRASVSANRRNIENALSRWAKEGLRDSRAALQAQVGTDGQAWAQPAAPADEGDVPSQIARLAELRDQGILTQEEFESKKRDLLDRM